MTHQGSASGQILQREEDGRWLCPECDQTFRELRNCRQHLRTWHQLQLGGNEQTSAPMIPPDEQHVNNNDGIQLFLLSRALSGYAQSFRLRLENAQPLDALQLRDLVFITLSNLIEQKLQELGGGLKFLLSVNFEYMKATNPDEKMSCHTNSKALPVVHINEIPESLSEAFNAISVQIESMTHRGSGWLIEKLIRLDIHFAKYQPLYGSGFIATPTCLQHRRAIINVQNGNDNLCFLWSILAGLFPPPRNPQRRTYYEQYRPQLNIEGIEFPVEANQFEQFERQNNLTLNVFFLDVTNEAAELNEDQIKLVYQTRKAGEPEPHPPHVNLLLLQKARNRHFCLIKDLSKLFRNRFHGGAQRICNYCLKRFYTDSNDKLINHLQHCRGREAFEPRIQTTERTVKFRNWNRCLEQALVLYCDFESFLVPLSTVFNNPENSFTERTHNHVPCSFGLLPVVRCCSFTPVKARSPPILSRGEAVIESFLDAVLEQAETLQQTIDHYLPLRLTRAEWRSYNYSTTCHICKQAFAPRGTDDWREHKCRDHCHICGSFRGAAHKNCNFQYRLNRDVTVVFHNGRRYDFPLLIQSLASRARQKGWTIDCLAKGPEDFLTFLITCTHSVEVSQKTLHYNIRFIDSYAFLSAPLASLAEATKADQFHLLKQSGNFATERELELALRKGIYPYEWVTEWSKFDVPELPPKSCFYNTLQKAEPTAEEYTKAQDVWNTFRMQTFGDYHDFYLKVDVLLLADVFENFRTFSLTHYGLDPVHYLSLPSLSWDACLKMTGDELQVPSSEDMYTFLEAGIRGGYSGVSLRTATANNKYMPEHKPQEPSSYILYLDLNNLYGYCMLDPLPTGDMCWIDPTAIQWPPPDGTGYVLEVDLFYPARLHDAHADLPLAPEHQIIREDDLSPYSLVNKPPGNLAKQTKLVATLKHKSRYIVHHRTLQFYLNHGLRIERIHRVLKFTEKAWMQPYIRFNTNMRKQALSDFERDLFKLAINALFGKSIENVRNYIDVRLVTCPEKLLQLVSNPRFQHMIIFSPDLVAVVMTRNKVTLNKPVQVGFSILDIAKLHLFSFHYDFMKAKYGANAKLLFTDTDSLCYHVYTNDVYVDIGENSEQFDLSNYPVDHPCYNASNAKVPGKMKDECASKVITQFVGHRSKVYSIKMVDGSEKGRAKGITRSVARMELNHALFLQVLTERVGTRHVMHHIRKAHGTVVTVAQNKRGLSAYDDKRWVCDDGIHTLPYGHRDAIQV